MKVSEVIRNIPCNVCNGPYYAMGNGATDDWAPLNAAISDGGTVHIPSGVYAISHPLVVSVKDTQLIGEANAVIVPTLDFKGEALIQFGAASSTLKPIYGGGISNLTVDVSGAVDPNLIGVNLVQAWFTHIERLTINGPKGLSSVQQTAFQISAGATEDSPDLANWSANINIYNLQISGSFRYAVRHCSGAVNPVKAQVNGVNYFGGFAFGAGKDRPGSVGFQLETGDSTRVYGVALEDFETGCFIGTQNQGPFDFRMEDCTTPFKLSSGIVSCGPTLAPIK